MIITLLITSLSFLGFNQIVSVYAVDQTLGWNNNIQYDDNGGNNPTTVVNVGDIVTWDWLGGNHDIDYYPQWYVDNGVPVPSDINTSIGDGADDPNLFGHPTRTSDSNTLYSYTFNQEGTYVYYCSVHGWLSQRGIVIVVDSSPVDNDGDGFTDNVDCNDADPAINPEAFDIPGDGIDQNCDGVDATFPIVDDPFEDILQGTIPIALEEISGNFVSPVHLTHAGDNSGRMFVVDQPGQIWVIDSSGTVLPTPFLDISSDIVPLPAFAFGFPPGPFNSFDERGLLGLTFHPDYANSGTPGFGKLYTYSSQPIAGLADFPISMADDNGDGEIDQLNHQSVITEWTVSSDPNVVDVLSARKIMRVDEPQFNHDGGQLEFGPDGYMYITFGDGGGADDTNDGHGMTGNGQNKLTILGTISRIDPLDPTITSSSDLVSANGQYRVPADNPFVGDSSGLDEIFAYGLRNAWRMSFNPFTNDLIAADVGQNLIEEINIITKGGNYGWNLKEGSFRFLSETGQISDDLTGLPNSLIDPVAEYDHDDGTSITGGYIYNGNALPVLTGLYVFGDFSTGFGSPDGRLFYTDLSDGIIREFITDGGNVNTFVKSTGQDEDGELYFLTGINLGPLSDVDGTTYGKVMKVVPSVIDTDGDGVLNEFDVCDGFDDTIDSDNDGIPDGCDDTPNGEDQSPVCDALVHAENSGQGNHKGIPKAKEVINCN